MYKLFHGVLALGMLGVLGFGYWSGARAQEQPAGSLSTVQDHEVTGVIQAIDDTSVTIDGTVYQMTDQTQKEGLLQVGDTATLEYSVGDDGTLTVHEISSDSEIETKTVDEQETQDTETEDDQGEDLDEDQSDDASLQQGVDQSQQSDVEHDQESESSGGDD